MCPSPSVHLTEYPNEATHGRNEQPWAFGIKIENTNMLSHRKNERKPSRQMRLESLERETDCLISALDPSRKTLKEKPARRALEIFAELVALDLATPTGR